MNYLNWFYFKKSIPYSGIMFVFTFFFPYAIKKVSPKIREKFIEK